MQFPVIILRHNESSIYFFSKKDELGLVSHNGHSFYKKKGIIYDCNGDKYEIIDATKIKKAPFFKSVKYFQPMYVVQLEVKFLEKTDLAEFKTLINQHIKKHERYWLQRDIISDLQEKINLIGNHCDIIKFLK